MKQKKGRYFLEMAMQNTLTAIYSEKDTFTLGTVSLLV